MPLLSVPQKSGDLKEIAHKSTEKGKRRAEMSKAERARRELKSIRSSRERSKKDKRNTSGRD